LKGHIISFGFVSRENFRQGPTFGKNLPQSKETEYKIPANS
jgi:hypothetical protein